MSTGFIILALVAAVLLVLIILMQNPKGGINSQLGASANVMGVKKTTDVLEKATWILAAVVLLSSIAATKFSDSKGGSKATLDANFKEAQKANLGASADTTAISAPVEDSAIAPVDSTSSYPTK
jgi:preprotein translocase subunit SecG